MLGVEGATAATVVVEVEVEVDGTIGVNSTEGVANTAEVARIGEGRQVAVETSFLGSDLVCGVGAATRATVALVATGV